MSHPEPGPRQLAEAERKVVKYFKYEAFAGAERLPASLKGIDGVPFTTVQVGCEDRPHLQPWIDGLLARRDADGNPFCLLVMQARGKVPEFWDAYLPPMWGLDYAPEPTPEAQAWTWVRMDLRLAVVHLSSAIRTWGFARMYSLVTEKPPTLSGIQAWLARPS